MNLLKEFERELSSRRAQISFSADEVEHFSVRSESGQKSRNESVGIDLSVLSTRVIQLRFLIQDNRLPGESSVTGLKRLASALNAEISPMTTWGWRYIHQVSCKDMPPSKKMQRAIERLFVKRVLGGAIQLEQVTVLAPVGYIQTNSILTTPSKQCARMNCPTSFVPNSSNHIYCTLECGRYSRREKTNNIHGGRNG